MSVLLSVSVLILQTGSVPGPATLEPRPALECAEHVTDARARQNCLRDLLRTSESELTSAREWAASEAADVDLMHPGAGRAQSALEAAQTAWVAYRDAECARQASLMLIDEGTQDEIRMDCQIALNRDRIAELRNH